MSSKLRKIPDACWLFALRAFALCVLFAFIAFGFSACNIPVVSYIKYFTGWHSDSRHSELRRQVREFYADYQAYKERFGYCPDNEPEFLSFVQSQLKKDCYWQGWKISWGVRLVDWDSPGETELLAEVMEGHKSFRLYADGSMVFG